MDYFPSRSFIGISNTHLGRKLWEWLNLPETIVKFKEASKYRRPAVAGITDSILAIFPELLLLSDRERDHHKRMIGHMTRQIMEASGYHLVTSNSAVGVKAGFFTKGTRYEHS
jgi:hypothetical protein